MTNKSAWAIAALLAATAILTGWLVSNAEDGITTAEIAIAFMGAFVGALGVLFATGAIATAYLLVRQSKEHREQVAEVIASYRTVLDGMIQQTNERIEAAIGALEEQHRELLAKMADTGERQIEEANRKFNDAISELRKYKVSPGRFGAIDPSASDILSLSQLLETYQRSDATRRRPGMAIADLIKRANQETRKVNTEIEKAMREAGLEPPQKKDDSDT